MTSQVRADISDGCKFGRVIQVVEEIQGDTRNTREYKWYKKYKGIQGVQEIEGEIQYCEVSLPVILAHPRLKISVTCKIVARSAFESFSQIVSKYEDQKPWAPTSGITSHP